MQGSSSGTLKEKIVTLEDLKWSKDSMDNTEYFKRIKEKFFQAQLQIRNETEAAIMNVILNGRQYRVARGPESIGPDIEKIEKQIVLLEQTILAEQVYKTQEHELKESMRKDF